MNWYGLIKQAKFINDHCAKCPKCRGYIEPVDIIVNPKHIYEIGQLFSCRCGQAKLWTNSIRDEANLIRFYNGEVDRYYQGFCNDRFAGDNFEYIYPLKNGYEMAGEIQRYDLMGTQDGRVQIALNGFAADGKSGGADNLIEWYRPYQSKIESLLT